jgi:23S rRNA (cytosine1962-C5)-methyltransferase
MQSIRLKPGKDAAVRRFHPWIFSGAIAGTGGDPSDGDTVAVHDHHGVVLGYGHFAEGNIAVKIFSFDKAAPDDAFWHQKIKNACDARRRPGITNDSLNNACRLVFSEGDRLPGLIIDYYSGVAVMQAHTTGMHRLLTVFTRSLQTIFGGSLTAVYDKSSDTLPAKSTVSGDKPGGQFIFGSSGPVDIIENGNVFRIDFVNGQKTGFFLDQRENRKLVGQYSGGRKVLNAFCYSGAFSVYALKGGAASVLSVDISARAVAWAKENAALNGFTGPDHATAVADVKQFLVTGEDRYDMIILDPPAFAKSHQVTNNALHAYKHINAAALKRLEPGGILCTFSCSQAISRETFRSMVQSAAIETGRRVRILHHLSQGPDHPADICHPEGEYLKGLIVEVD